jgi:ATP-dependent Clp protease ATP-binding subunit ClpA
MWERFTKRARAAVTASADLARDAGAEQIAPVHLLGAVVQGRPNVATEVLASCGADLAALESGLLRRGRAPGGLDDDDAEALAAIGIDLDEVLRHVTPGPRGSRAPRFAKPAKKVLELSLREAIALRHNYIGCEHLLLGVVRTQDPTVLAALEEQGIDTATLRDAVRDAVRRAG